jgi:3-oxoacyl-[acyl-carrier-protein] synthase-1
MHIAPARIRAHSVTTALGHGCTPHLRALREMRSGLRRAAMDEVPAASWVGIVDGVDAVSLPDDLIEFDCRNNRLAELALAGDDFAEQVIAARHRWGATRIGLFLGTSTSGIRHTEQCYKRHFEKATPGLGDALRFNQTHAYNALVDYCRRRLGLHGPALVISTACSSGAKTFAAAHRALAAGFCDAAVVGGVDSLCATTLTGFHALGLLSPFPCTPWDEGRCGISIGEGAAFALLDMETQQDTGQDDGNGLTLLGYGESNDAYHITAPHPEGAGAVLAMRAALDSAGLTAGDIDYVNLHATGTHANDQSEDTAVHAVFGTAPSASATKGYTGHTLGAAGAVEAILCLLCLRAGLIPGTINTTTVDPALSTPVIVNSRAQPISRVLTNSFGFAGNNCALVLGRA